MPVSPLSTPTRYEEKEFLQSLFGQELKAVDDKLREQVVYIGHQPSLGLRGKILTIAGAVLWAYVFVGFGFGVVHDGDGLVDYGNLGRQGQSASEWFYQVLSIFSAATLAFAGIVWSWDNFHRIRASWKYRNEQRLHLTITTRQERLTFDQKFTSSSTTEIGPGGMGPISGLKFVTSSDLELTRRPYTRVGLVQDMRDFAEDVSTVFDGLYVGIDELDKIHDPEEVRRFLRGIEGIFTIPGVCYVLTISKEAVGSFGLRHLSDVTN